MAEKEYIEREAAIAEVEEWYDMYPDSDAAREALSLAKRAIRKLPAADVAPVVRCKECYAYRKDKELAKAAYLDGEMYCALLRCEMPQDGFCYYGKRNCGARMDEEENK